MSGASSLEDDWIMEITCGPFMSSLICTRLHIHIKALTCSNLLLTRFCGRTHPWPPNPGTQPPPITTMAEDADMRNELEEMQRRADQLADEVRGGNVSREQKIGSCLIQVQGEKGLLLMSQLERGWVSGSAGVVVKYDCDFLYTKSQKCVNYKTYIQINVLAQTPNF